MSNTTDVHNAYLRVFTSSLGCNDNNEGLSWGFLVVKHDAQLHVYIGTPEWRGRIAAVQNLSGKIYALFEDTRYVTFSNNDNNRCYFDENNPWTSLVKLNDEDYKLLTENPDWRSDSRANKIISYLRRNVSGMDDDTTVYEVPENTYTENELHV